MALGKICNKSASKWTVSLLNSSDWSVANCSLSTQCHMSLNIEWFTRLDFYPQLHSYNRIDVNLSLYVRKVLRRLTFLEDREVFQPK